MNLLNSSIGLFHIREIRVTRGFSVGAGFLLFTLLFALNVSAAKKPAKMAAKPKIPAGKPEIFQLEPRGIQRGVPSKIKLIGTNLIGLTELMLHDPKIAG